MHAFKLRYILGSSPLPVQEVLDLQLSTLEEFLLSLESQSCSL